MKYLESLLITNPNLFANTIEPKIEPIHHLIFTSTPTDNITIPLCGRLNVQVNNRIEDITCSECLDIAKELSELDTHLEAITLARTKAPDIITPDPEIMKQRHGDGPTKEARRHIKAKDFLQLHGLTNPEELATNIVGAEEATYFWNMTELGLVDLDGNALEIQINENLSILNP